jgi:hypothetical protein
MTPFNFLFLCFISCLIAYLTATNPNHLSVSAVLLSCIPLWPIVAWKSKNIMQDALIYDITLTICYTCTIMIMSSTWLGPRQYVGIIVAITGILIFKMGG